MTTIPAVQRPQRVWRRRTAGSKLPTDPRPRCVGRPGAFGNPFRIGQLVRDCVPGWPSGDDVVRDHGHAVDLFRTWALATPSFAQRVRAELAGLDLACWCRPDLPCHADVLLELANPTGDSE